MAELVIALDYPEAAPALDMARRLSGTVPWVKVGLELFTAEGPALLNELKSLGFNVFLDMKFFDIPNTVRGAVRSAVRSGADMVNIHLLGGRRMAEAALEGRDEGASPGAPLPILLGVTVLTSMDQEDLPFEYSGAIGELVLDLAVKGEQYGLNGVVCSAWESERIKRLCGDGFFCLTPGIRPAGSDAGDQRRVMTPSRAVAAGSDYLVVGRPVTQAEDPLQQAVAIMNDMGA
ncbi:orotidine-5'-phosphate decarboxylase [Salidesulfovibrio brasiliensis]|uniref:orotidine-5'-phosphate decarboxylase n=1 Tax=Salidesulfovibrio brasiliensis TaxID=221711 RepID=UPI0006D11437|nr:orotidine-5'-phosphate decarboxylase [Salidesulfovibrio brasiliensis]